MYRRVFAMSAALVGVLASGSLALAQESHPDIPSQARIMPNGTWVRVTPQGHPNWVNGGMAHWPAARQLKLGDYYIGLALGDVSDTLRSQLRLDDRVGIAVASVADESPAGEAGLLQHDVLVRVDGDDIVSHQMLIDAVQKAGKEDRMLALEYLRAGEMHNLELKAKKRDKDSAPGFQVPGSDEVSSEQDDSSNYRFPGNGRFAPEWILEHLQKGGNQAELQEQIDDLRHQLEQLREELKDQSGDE